MTWIRLILADYVRRGKVTLEIPGFDMDELRKEINGKANRLLCDVINVVFNEDMTDREKVEEIQHMLV